MSGLHFLGGADFEIPVTSAPVSRGGLFRRLRDDPAAFSIALVMVHALRSAQFDVEEPVFEAKNSAWFRCLMNGHDLGVSVAITGRNQKFVSVSTFTGRIERKDRHGPRPPTDPRCYEISENIKMAVLQQFGNQPGFRWIGEERIETQ